MKFIALTSTLSLMLQTPSSSQKQTAAEVTDGALKDRRANRYTCWLACCSLNTHMYTHTHAVLTLCSRTTLFFLCCSSVGLNLQDFDIITTAQLLDDKGGEGEGRTAMMEVVQEVKILH